MIKMRTSDIEKYLDKHRATGDLKDLQSNRYTNRTATGLASLDGSIQVYNNEIFVSGIVMISFTE